MLIGQMTAVLRRVLIGREDISKVCEAVGCCPSQVYRWQKQLFDTGAMVFERSNGSADKRVKAADARAAKLEAKLGRMVASEVERAAQGKVGQARDGKEAAELQGALAGRADSLARDMAELAASGRQGETNPAEQMLESAAKEGEREPPFEVSLEIVSQDNDV